MKKLIYIIILVLIAIIIGLLFNNACNREIKEKTEYIEVKVPIIKKIPIPIPIPSDPKIINNTIYIYDTIYEFDTIEVVKDYYKKYAYSDTILNNDSLGFIALYDTIQMNRLIARYPDIRLYQKTITKTTIEPAKGWYIGGEINTNNDIEIDISYLRNRLILIGGAELNRITEDQRKLFLKAGIKIKIGK